MEFICQGPHIIVFLFPSGDLRRPWSPCVSSCCYLPLLWQTKQSFGIIRPLFKPHQSSRHLKSLFDPDQISVSALSCSTVFDHCLSSTPSFACCLWSSLPPFLPSCLPVCLPVSPPLRPPACLSASMPASLPACCSRLPSASDSASAQNINQHQSSARGSWVTSLIVSQVRIFSESTVCSDKLGLSKMYLFCYQVVLWCTKVLIWNTWLNESH